MQSPFLDVAALFSAAVRMGLFGAGMLWQCLEPIWVGLLARLRDASFGCPVWGWVWFIIVAHFMGGFRGTKINLNRVTQTRN